MDAHPDGPRVTGAAPGGRDRTGPEAGATDLVGAEPGVESLVGAQADERLLDAGASVLPDAVGRPEALPVVRARGAIVAVGTAATGVTLLAGIALVVLAIVSAFANGADVLDGVLVAIGFALVGTHWGWVHVAEATANAVQARATRGTLARREQWRRAIAPFAHHEVHTEVEDDGSIVIVELRFAPVALGGGRFTFAREILRRERHAEHEPAALVAERAEQIRREAALATDRERRRFLAAAERHDVEQMQADLESAQRRERQAASRALSEQINANLRRAPLDD